MSDQPQSGRRKALKFLAGAPLLPLSTNVHRITVVRSREYLS